jgi:hypothetical protein
MYVFLVLGIPLGFVLLDLVLYPKEELIATKRAFHRGLVSFIPICIVARVLGFIVPAMPGSAWGALHEWADRMLPYAFLPAAMYPVFYRYGERLPPGVAERRLTAFFAGALSPVGLVEMIRMWGRPDTYGLFLLPLLLGAMVLIMPRVALDLRDGYGSGLVLTILASAAGTLAASFLPLLFLRRLWPLSWLAALAAIWLGWILALPGLSRRPPPQSE